MIGIVAHPRYAARVGASYKERGGNTYARGSTYILGTSPARPTGRSEALSSWSEASYSRSNSPIDTVEEDAFTRHYYSWLGDAGYSNYRSVCLISATINNSGFPSSGWGPPQYTESHDFGATFDGGGYVTYMSAIPKWPPPTTITKSIKSTVLTTVSANGAWETSTTTSSFNRMTTTWTVGTSMGHPDLYWSESPGVLTGHKFSDRITGYDVTVYARTGQIGIYFSKHDMPFTDGQTFGPLQSTTYSYGNDNPYYAPFSTTETVTYSGDDGEGNTYSGSYEEWPNFFCNIPYSSFEINSPPNNVKIPVLTYDTAAFPRPGWGAGEDSTYARITLWRINVTQMSINAPPNPNTSEGTSWSGSMSDGNSEITWQSWGATTTWSGSSFFQREVTLIGETPLPTTIPVHGGGGYLVATAKSGWVLPKEGFHTADPYQTTASAAVTSGDGFITGSARPGVTLYVPLGGATPNHAFYTGSYIGGKDILTTSIKTKNSNNPDYYAFTTTQSTVQGSSTAVTTITSPDVVVVSVAGATAPQTITITPTGQASEYGLLSPYGGGYEDLPITWTFVACEMGLLVVYADTTSKTTFFSEPSTAEFDGSEGSYFSFIPCITNSLWGGDGRIASMPAYNYDEF